MAFIKIISFLLIIPSTFYATAASELKPNSRVIGGTQAKPGEYPYLAQIRSKESSSYNNVICGGSIVHPQYILTAAQCVYDRWAGRIYVSVGSVVTGWGWDISINRIVLRDPYFQPNTSSPDVALLELHTPLEFGQVFSIIYTSSLHQPETLDGAGWGWPIYSGEVSPALEYLTLNTISNTKCEERLGSKIAADKICTSRVDNNRGFCGADLGGPLVYYGWQIGIIGWIGYGCDSDKPDVHTRVAPYANWISNIVTGKYSGICIKSEDLNADSQSTVDRNRVADGFLAQRSQFPYQAQIFWKWSSYYKELVCGATIIHQRYLLTSAECVYDKIANELWVVMGDTRIDYGWGYEVMRIVLRDPYYEPNAPNDIALLEIHGEIWFDTEVAPISYISGMYEPEAVNASGYGWPWFAGEAAPALQYATLNTITNAKCAEKWGSRITSDKICTAQTNGRSTCRKDAGGPLSYYGLLIGIIGGTDDECGTGAPNVHTRIAPYSNWITNIISGRYSGACTEII
ncbi:trypsin [Holotrichia oblita]|uniref:Trypsin n=1 Tax=Holotrichia oblita TaxID=644536 RepID=A0ACB9SQ86_HOLOL|nr:trypsin [Holotrichia oblita]